MTKEKSLPKAEEVLAKIEEGTYKERGLANLLIDIFTSGE